MGLWSKVGGGLMMIGGVALTAATGGAAAPIGAGLVAGGAKVMAAGEQKDAAKKAEAQLQAASNKAIGTLETAKAESQKAYQPYTANGAAAMGALGDFMGLPTGTSQAPSAQGPLASGFTGGVPSVGDLPAGTQQALGVRTPSATATPAGTAVPRAGLAGPAATVQTQGAQQTASGYTPLGGVGAGGLVQMRAPTGQTSWVPRSQAPFYAQRGAVEVG